MIIALAAVVLAVSLFVPWFKATVRIRGSGVSGFLIDPPVTVSGMAVHGYLWAGPIRTLQRLKGQRCLCRYCYAPCFRIAP